MNKRSKDEALDSAPSPHFSVEPEAAEFPAWTEVEAGRFMPRRVRGSCRGRALGWTFVVPSSRADDPQAPAASVENSEQQSSVDNTQ